MVGDYEDKSRGDFECGEMPQGGIVYDAKDTVEDLKNCGWSEPDQDGGLLRTKRSAPIRGGIKARKAYPWMEYMCFNLFSQKQLSTCVLLSNEFKNIFFKFCFGIFFIEGVIVVIKI